MNKFFLGMVTTALVTTSFAANNNNTLSEQEAYKLGSQLATSNKDVSDALKQGMEDAKRENRESKTKDSERRQDRDSVQESITARKENNSTNEVKRNNIEQKREERESQNRGSERRQDQNRSQETENSTSQAKRSLEQQPNVSRNGLDDRSFFTENGRRLGIVTTDSGLQYQVLKAGLGRIPHLQHNVRISYEVKDINDKVISKQSDKLIRLNHLTPALADGVETMREKGKSRFFIPAGLNSDTKELGTSIPENVPLIIDLELQNID